MLVIHNKVYLEITITIMVQIKRLNTRTTFFFGDCDTAEGAERMPDVRQASDAALTDYRQLMTFILSNGQNPT